MIAAVYHIVVILNFVSSHLVKHDNDSVHMKQQKVA